MRRSGRVVDLCCAVYAQRYRNEVLYRNVSSSAEVTKEIRSRAPTSQLKKLAEERNIPIEKYSLSRGLALNRFEKDFVIYPEYSDPDALLNIRSFVSTFQKDFETSMSNVTKEAFYDAYRALSERHQLPAAFVTKEFGGLEMCNKDLLTIYEVLGLNWNVFTMVDQVQIASSLLTIYGNDEQKSEWLPRIASGELSPAICLAEENLGIDFESMKTTIRTGGDSTFKINGFKTEVIGASNANLFFIFGNLLSPLQNEKNFTCFIVERDNTTKNSIIISPRVKTLGLNLIEVSKVEFKDLTVDQERNKLGSVTEGKDAALEVTASRNITYAGAVTGFMRSLIGKLAQFCNSTVQHNLNLSENRGIQRLMTDLALNTYVLESMVYYVGGLRDENLIITTDIENAIIHRCSNRVLREAIATVIQILGFGSCDCQLEFEKMFRDVVTVLSLGNMEMALVDQVSMGTITTWAKTNALDLSQLRSGTAKFFDRLFGKRAQWHLEKTPKLKHYIAEHAHPSLQEGCRNLEYTMARLNAVLGAVLVRKGKHLVTDFETLCQIAEVVECNLGMMATIARASRSYSVGLRHSDIEIAWTTTYCAYSEHKAHFMLALLERYFGLVQMNPSLLNIGRAVLDFKGYCVESPTELNW